MNIFETILNTVARPISSIVNFYIEDEVIVSVNEKTLHLIIEMMVEHLKQKRNPLSVKYSIIKEPFIHEPYRPKVTFIVDDTLSDYTYTYTYV